MAPAQLPPPSTYSHVEDVIYGRKYGMALTLDVYKPAHHARGIGVLLVCSGGWYSDHALVNTNFSPYWRNLIKRGYTVFAVVHSSNPRFTIPDALDDMNRAVRFVRYHAKEYGINPDKLGITGGSAGGHLSIWQGTGGDNGNPKAPDPVDRVSSKVQAVGCFFPPTDFLNYGTVGHMAIGAGISAGLAAPFQFQEWDKDNSVFKTATDPTEIRNFATWISPIYHVSATSAPTLIFHGDADPIVPVQQSESFIDKLKQFNVPCELIIEHGKVHGWVDGFDRDMNQICDWFDKYLK